MSAAIASCAPDDRLATRAGQLAAGLRRFRIGRNQRVTVFVSDLSGETEIAVRSLRSLECEVTIVGVPAADAEVAAAAATIVAGRPDAVFTCAQGAAALRAAGVRAPLFGDCPGVLWTRAIELHEAHAARSGPSVAQPWENVS
ncbi:hypothetical protein WIS52_06455 [Pseudonocardia nematodicida]|uniref:Uncharacterized protein n=1 Tax=Pseudonocardia nematodicida TaxID=1206997 RepID=A0ABV1K8D0_9PSEU